MIWRHNGGFWEPSNVQRIPNFVPGIIAAPGPSLRLVQKGLMGPVRFVLALNTAYPLVMPNAWVGMDRPAQYRASLTRESFPKFWRGNYRDINDRQGVRLNSLPGNFFVDLAEPHYPDAIFHWLGDDAPLIWHRASFHVGIHLLLRMGFRTLYFAGCDFSEGYCHKDVELTRKQQDRNNRHHDQVLAWFKWFVRRGADFGITCRSLTPCSPINEFCAVSDMAAMVRGLSLPTDTSVAYVGTDNNA